MNLTPQTCKCGREVYFLPCNHCKRVMERARLGTMTRQIQRLKAEVRNLKVINEALRKGTA